MNLTIKENISLNFKDFSAGWMAEELSSNPQVLSGRKATMTTTHDSLIRAALYASGIKSGSRIKAVIAIPYGWISDGPEICKRISKRWEVGGKVFDLEAVSKAQGTLALCNYAYTPQGLDLTKFDNTLVIGPGGQTTELIGVRRRHGNNVSDSIEKGSRTVAKKLKAYLKTQGVHITDQKAMKAVIDGKYYSDGWRDDVPVKLNDFWEEVALSIFETALGMFGSETVKEFELKYLTGGPSVALLPHLQRLMSGVVLSQYPIFDNALGAYHWARDLASREQVPMGLDVGYSHTKVCSQGETGLIKREIFRSCVGEHVQSGELAA